MPNAEFQILAKDFLYIVNNQRVSPVLVTLQDFHEAARNAFLIFIFIFGRKSGRQMQQITFCKNNHVYLKGFQLLPGHI